MPQVPDIPGVVPQTQPFERPVPLPGINVPREGFTAVADAMDHFGLVGQGAAQNVFNRALALKQLQVEGKLRDLNTNYYNEVAPIEQDFLSKEGENAGTDALRTHTAQISAVQQKYAAMADQYGPYGRNTFGADSAAMTRSFIQRATMWSATQTRESLKASHRAAIGALQQQARGAQTPEELETINGKIEAEQNQIGAMEGAASNTTRFNADQEISKSNTQNTIGSMERDPLHAPQIADRAINTGRINSEGRDAIDKAIPSFVQTGIRTWHERLLAGTNISLGEQKIDPDRLTQAVLGNEKGLVRGVKFRDPKTGEEKQALDGGIMPSSLPGFLKDAGLPPMTPEEYQAQTQEWKYNFIKGILTRSQDKYGNANDAAEEYFTGQPITEKRKRDPFHDDTWYLGEFNKRLAKTASADEIGGAAQRFGDSIATTTHPDIGEVYREGVIDRQGAEERRKIIARNETSINIGKAIEGGNPNTGMPYQDYNEFKANPNNTGSITAYEDLVPDAAKRISDQIKGFNDVFKARTNEVHFNTIMAEYKDDKQKFMEDTEGVWADNKLGKSDKIRIARLRGDLHAQGYKSVSVNKVFDEMRERYYNEIPDKTNDPGGYNAYVADLHGAVEAYEEKTEAKFPIGSPEGTKAMEEIHNWLISKNQRGYQVYADQKVDDEFYKGAKRADPAATDDTIRYDWMAMQARNMFDQLWGRAATERLGEWKGFTPLGTRRQVPQLPPPPPPPPIPPGYVARPRYGAQAPAQFEITAPFRGGVPPEALLEPEQEAALAAAARRGPTPPPAPAVNIRAERIREAQTAAETKEAKK